VGLESGTVVKYIREFWLKFLILTILTDFPTFLARTGLRGFCITVSFLVMRYHPYSIFIKIYIFNIVFPLACERMYSSWCGYCDFSNFYIKLFIKELKRTVEL
jgi:hypothetical protein